MMNNAAMNQSLYTDGTAISSLPTNDVQYGNDATMQPQQLPNYNAMYKQDNTPLVGAASPGQTESMGPMEPMAANSVLGGGFGSLCFGIFGNGGSILSLSFLGRPGFFFNSSGIVL
jgi:hypothetical protein